MLTKLKIFEKPNKQKNQTHTGDGSIFSWIMCMEWMEWTKVKKEYKSFESNQPFIENVKMFMSLLCFHSFMGE